MQHEEQLMAERAGDEIHRIWLVSIRTVREVLGVLRVCVQTEKKYGFAMARDRTVFPPSEKPRDVWGDDNAARVECAQVNIINFVETIASLMATAMNMFQGNMRLCRSSRMARKTR